MRLSYGEGVDKGKWTNFDIEDSSGDWNSCDGLLFDCFFDILTPRKPVL